ncbi:uncharacterized protein METZ01_LOCUS35121 [marine metagenome]|uniref:AB hydrolase-1 domain-containing protein n=1 Tax=marine metagenome TaxID=408172 RepID=A0A381QX21_9ZZZZ
MSEEKAKTVDELISIREVESTDLPDGTTGEGLQFKTSRGDFAAILHRASNADQGVIWVCGARGGFGGPGPDTYARMAEKFIGEGITSLRLDYRYANDVFECALDLLAGVAFLKGTGHEPVVVVGHSFGGAVVIAAAANSAHIKGVVALSPQTYGAGMAGQVAPRKLLVVHGKADTRLAFACGQQIYDMANEPKELVLYEGAEHRLEECRDDLEELLGRWIPETLAAEIVL